ncbi:hypothetical protein LC087_15410 [Bacillus carboniphilus]|uniref:Uncharacterized protein n=1 Tax=Bacillus carboniphilus TaxID=86663 RepID=A0ABY9JUH3_9BACI|nr:hypothetical protein [Bacillus carboniphilus]WLR42133.1 hypothetical protein LC087_15410 [Bacillus carboniphilus]
MERTNCFCKCAHVSYTTRQIEEMVKKESVTDQIKNVEIITITAGGNDLIVGMKLFIENNKKREPFNH